MSDAIDPGVQRLVAWLQKRAFQTTDSGDGVTKIAAGWGDEALPYAHVFISVGSYYLQAESRRLMRLLSTVGVEVLPLGPGNTPSIQASYDPVANTAIISLMNVTDDMLPAALPGMR